MNLRCWFNFLSKQMHRICFLQRLSYAYLSISAFWKGFILIIWHFILGLVWLKCVCVAELYKSRCLWNVCPCRWLDGLDLVVCVWWSGPAVTHSGVWESGFSMCGEQHPVQRLQRDTRWESTYTHPRMCLKSHIQDIYILTVLCPVQQIWFKTWINLPAN